MLDQSFLILIYFNTATSCYLVHVRDKQHNSKKHNIFGDVEKIRKENNIKVNVSKNNV